MTVAWARSDTDRKEVFRFLRSPALAGRPVDRVALRVEHGLLADDVAADDLLRLRLHRQRRLVDDQLPIGSEGDLRVSFTS